MEFKISRKIVLLFLLVFTLGLNMNAQDIKLSGNWGYTYSLPNNKVRIEGDKIENNSQNGTSGSLKLSLYLTETRYDGQGINGYVVSNKTMKPLKANYYLYDLDYTFASKKNTPTGYYYVTLVLLEYGSDNKFCIVDYLNFDKRIRIDYKNVTSNNDHKSSRIKNVLPNVNHNNYSNTNNVNQYKAPKVQTYRMRVGAVCRDGSRSSATGRGACSWHGGVSRWLYKEVRK